MALFKRGYDVVEEEKQKQEERRERSRSRLWDFFIQNDGEEADILFLTEEPVNFYVHTHPQTTAKGKTMYVDTLCMRDCFDEECEYCNEGERSTFKGAYLVVDRREYEYTNNEGKKVKGRDQVKLYTQGTKVLSQLQRLSDRYGLTDNDYTVVRIGKGQSTTYVFERGDKIKLTSKEIENFLPDFLKEKYDGTMKSLYAIVEEQIMSMSPEGTDLDSEEDDEADVLKRVKDKLVGVEDTDKKPVKPKKPLGLKSKLNVNEDSKKPKIKTVLSRK